MYGVPPRYLHRDYEPPGLFFFPAEDRIRDWSVTGVQTCALPISWQKGTAPCIEAYLPPAPRSPSAAHPVRQKLLEELIKIDLEYCWRKRVQRLDSPAAGKRSEERRVGKECRSRWAAHPYEQTRDT